MLKKELEDLIKEIAGGLLAEERKKAEAAAAEAAKNAPVARQYNVGAGQAAASLDGKDAEKGANNVGTLLRYVACAKRDGVQLLDYAKRQKNKFMIGEIEKAMGESTIAGGGAMLPGTFADEVIELLSAATIVRKAGIQVVPMKGSYTQSYVSTGSTAYWVGESTNITKSQPALGQLQLSDKKLAALVPISNDLLRSGGPRADNVIRNDLIRCMRLKEDATFIRSLGTENEPRGLRAWATLADMIEHGTAACNTLAKMVLDVNMLLTNLMANDVPVENCFFILSPRSYRQANACTDLAGTFVFRQEMAGGKFWGLPYFVTSQISDAMSTDQSEIYLCSKEYPIIAENETMIVDVFDQASYYDGSSVVSAVSRDETVMRAISLEDFGCRMRGKEVAMLDQVEWGLSA